MALQHTLAIVLAVGLIWPAGAARPETLFCPASDASVAYDQLENAELACDAVAQATALFSRCNIPQQSRPVHISIVRDLGQGCLGLYHCKENKVEVVSPMAMKSGRDPKGVFAHLTVEELFRSVVVHELTHAATSNMPCPFEECIVAEEYLSYAMQVMSLTRDSRLAFEEGYDFDRRVSSDELISVILYLAPDLFAQKVWAHLSQRDEPCGYVGHLISGTILLDRERF